MTSTSDFKSFTDIEHVRARPDMYIGGIKNTTEERWIIDDESKTPIAEKSEIKYNPGLEQCILELITNATDHAERCSSLKNAAKKSKKDQMKLVTKIKIDIDKTSVSVYNDGPGIPIQVHPDTITDTCPGGMYVPEMIFGNLRTSSNYDDSQKKTWGGKNGIGAKAANIYSNMFIIECLTDGQLYYQEFTEGMTIKTEPKIKKKTGKDYTKITYFPDFKAFKMTSFDTNGTKHLIEKRAYDSSASTPKTVSVYFNQKKIEIKDFSNYVSLFIGSSKKVMYTIDRWEIGFALCPFDEPTQISFVNGVCTDEGGSHVSHILDPVLNKITKTLQESSKAKGVTIRKQYIKDNVIVFVKALIDNPAFNGQLKRKLVSKVSEFGSRCDIPDDIIKKISKLGITNNVLEIAKAKEMNSALKKLDGTKKIRLSDIKKLEDATWAGTKKSDKCTLILTEGDSAKGMALNGIAAAGGVKCWGIFPLRGKFLNIRTATASQLMKNEEMIAINRILGLKPGMTDITKLRYARVMALTDQDSDGFHIKGLLINYFTFNWPELVEQGLIECLLTPVIKVFKGKNAIKNFYNTNDYESWNKSEERLAITGKLRVKYYKGLGTSTASEAKEYFSDLSNNRIKYKFNEKKHLPKVILAFDKEYADKRKEWITEALIKKDEIDYNKKDVSIGYFIDRELVLFSIYDNERSIPNIMDGLKPSQRKILYGCLKKNLFLKSDGAGEIKVAQLSGYISEQAAYHHGEVSLQNTIVSMAQEFVGSGNLNLLFPSGFFGSRQQGGKDAASARYIFTYLRPEVKLLFNETDNLLLKYLEDDGTKIEPEFYVPIVPLLLLNGSTGIGTGWSTNFPCFKLEDIVENLITLLEDEDAQLNNLNPYYNGFLGTITKISDTMWVARGVVTIINNDTIEITELPIGTWKEDYKNFLDKLLDTDKIRDFSVMDKKDSDANYICFRIRLKKSISDTPEDLTSIVNFFKLEKNITTTNMVAFNKNGLITKYGSAEDVLWEFYKYRLDMYVKRRKYLINTLQERIKEISEQVRFVELVISDKIIVFKKKKSEIEQELVTNKFEFIDRLLSMKLHQFTSEEIEKLRNNLDNLEKRLIELKSISPKDIWKSELTMLTNSVQS
jgi:DNA topoisomerase-2